MQLLRSTLPFLLQFEEPLHNYAIPDHLSMMRNHTPHPLCALAAQQLQTYLQTQQEWEHNFGLDTHGKGSIIGKMFGVMVVQTAYGEIGFLCAFSGKLAGTNTHPYFVPPIFDGLEGDSFLTAGMVQLQQQSDVIRQLEAQQEESNQPRIRELKAHRKQYSANLQQQLFEHYQCVNAAGAYKGIPAIFKQANYQNPPAGAAECATPKLLQYAFLNQLKPLAVAEFWWGQSPKSDYWKHGKYYPCCKEKCEPILGWMLEGLSVDTV